MRRSAKILWSVVIAATLGLTSTPASAMWTYWGQWLPVVSFQQRYKIEAAGATTFWSTQFNFVEQPQGGGYVGVQTDGYGMDHGVRNLAIFSLWDAISVKPGRGASCGEFGGEGVGLSCRAPITVQAGHMYGVRVSRIAYGEGRRAWSTYAASVRNYTTGEKADLGRITVPYVVSMTPPANFIEYFGPTVPCRLRPHAAATFQAPLVATLEKGPMRVLEHDGTSNPQCEKEIATFKKSSVLVSTGTDMGSFDLPPKTPNP